MRRTLPAVLVLAVSLGFVHAADASPTASRTINGTPRSDELEGTATADTINGRAGFDSVLGLGGNDTLDGGPDQDFVRGGPGNDRLIESTQGDADSLYGDEGNDRIVSKNGDFVMLDGGPGDDRLIFTGSSEAAVASILGGSGVDTITVHGPRGTNKMNSPLVGVTIRDGRREVVTCTGNINLKVVKRDRIDVIRGCRYRS